MRLLPQCTPIPCPQAATTWYRSPELLLGSTSNSAAADMWRYGIEVHTGVWMSGDVWTVPSLRLPAAARMRRDGPQRCLHRDLALARNTQNILVPSSVPEAASSAIQSSDTVIRAWTECRSQTGNRALPPPPPLITACSVGCIFYEMIMAKPLFPGTRVGVVMMSHTCLVEIRI